MKVILYLATALCVMGLAFWAYHTNYATQDRQTEMRKLKNEIASLQEGLSVLRAEWAYLNRPDRLRELVNLNFASLGLLPLAPEQFGTAAQVAYPQPEAPVDPLLGGLDEPPRRPTKAIPVAHQIDVDPPVEDTP